MSGFGSLADIGAVRAMSALPKADIQLRRFIFYQLGVGSDRLADSRFGNCAMILEPVATQNIDDRSAQGHLPIRLVAIVEYHVSFACQHIKYGIDALASFLAMMSGA